MTLIKSKISNTMKTIISLITLFLLLSHIVSSENSLDDLSGKWKTAEGHMIIISKTGNSYTGVLEGTDNIVLKDIMYTQGKWKGTIQKGEEQKSADCEIVLNGTQLIIVVTKYIFSKTLVWTKK